MVEVQGGLTDPGGYRICWGASGLKVPQLIIRPIYTNVYSQFLLSTSTPSGTSVMGEEVHWLWSHLLAFEHHTYRRENWCSHLSRERRSSEAADNPQISWLLRTRRNLHRSWVAVKRRMSSPPCPLCPRLSHRAHRESVPAVPRCTICTLSRFVISAELISF